jgi:integrase/recombinase XerD
MSKSIPRIHRSVIKRLQFAAPYLDDFKEWLREAGYRAATIEELLRLLAGWTDWTSTSGFTLGDVSVAFEASQAFVKGKNRIKCPGDISQPSLGAAKLFIGFLRERGLVSLPKNPPFACETWPILREFRDWMRQHRGLAETTLDLYQGVIIGFLEVLGDDPSAFTAEAVRTFVLRRAEPHGRSRARCITVAIRSFLRFLVAVGRCPAGREHAVPAFANWRLASVPKFLVTEDIERVISACQGESWLRDNAIILLLARLGLRASEVANLKYSDLDWKNGRIAVFGKSRREEWLPLTQEIGDAILAYLERDRPPLRLSRLFITDIAPLRPLSRIAVKCIVSRTLTRAGVKSSAKGAHVLRHSAATAMLRNGVSLTGVGSVLRHNSPTVTMHYAKVDFGLLAEIAQPWPGVLPC